MIGFPEQHRRHDQGHPPHLEGEALGVFKLGVFQDLGRAYGLADYESLLGPTRANDARTVLP